jgi:hypothetical protein
MISYEYLLRYRLASGDASLDSTIARSSEWVTRMYTDRYTTFRGVSTRQDMPDATHKAVPMLLGLESLTATSAHYCDMAELLLDRIEASHVSAPVQHGGIAWIAAASAHSPSAAASARGARRAPCVQRFKSQATEYVTIEQPGYQSFIAFRSFPPRKGLQTWAVRGEPPFIFPEDGAPSTIRFWGYDSATRNITDWDVVREDRGAQTSVTARSGDLTSSYLITPYSLVVVHSFGSETDSEVIWSGSDRHIGGYHVNGPSVTASGAKGGLYWWGMSPRIGQDGFSVVFRETAATLVFAFSSNSFERLGEVATRNGQIRVSWRDDGGRFDAVLNHSAERLALPTGFGRPHDEGVAQLEPCEVRIAVGM